MNPYCQDDAGYVQVFNGDCADVLRSMPDASVDAIVTDPPYGLSFMGKKWDYDVPSVDVWRECLRVLKPGGHLLSFAGTRTQHRMAVNIEDAGFEIRDMIAWVYGSGFPKSHNVAKAIHGHITVGGSSPKKRRQAYMGDDYAEGDTVGSCGTERAQERKPCAPPPGSGDDMCEESLPWNGWGTALKPAMEPITVARRPLIGTVAANVLAHGTGAINVDACRVGHNEPEKTTNRTPRTDDNTFSDKTCGFKKETNHVASASSLGRWPANLIHDGGDEVVGLFPVSSVTGKRTPRSKAASVEGTAWLTDNHESQEYTDSGSAARFYYCAKASKRDRDEGCEGLPLKPGGSNEKGYTEDVARGLDRNRPTANHHPTVKPTDLMRYLCRLITPPNGIVLDPFMGSGSTGKAAIAEGFRFIGIEREAEYCEIAVARIGAGRRRQEVLALQSRPMRR